MVVAFIALFMAIGGGSYALAQLPSRSVGAKQLKRSAVRTANLANNAVTGAKVRRDALTGADIRENTLAGVASAVNATHANAAAVLDRVVYVSVTAPIAPAPVDGQSGLGGGTANCPAGHFPVGGGATVSDAAAASVVDSSPSADFRGWTVRADNGDTTAGKSFQVFAVCVAASARG